MSTSRTLRTIPNDEALSLRDALEVLTGLREKLVRYDIVFLTFFRLVVLLEKKMMSLQVLWQWHVDQCAHAHISHRKESAWGTSVYCSDCGVRCMTFYRPC